jgi:hypothetical protein
VALGSVHLIKLPSINSKHERFKTQADIASNKVTTAQYTILNFFPKNLFKQFKQVSSINLEFLSYLFLGLPAGQCILPDDMRVANGPVNFDHKRNPNHIRPFDVCCGSSYGERLL